MPKAMTTDEFGAFYQKTIQVLYRYVLLRVGSREVAEDIASSSYMRLWQAVADGRVENTEAYLFQIARNSIADHFRFSGRTVSIEDERQGEGESVLERTVDERSERERERIESVSTQSALFDKIRALPEEEHLVIALRYIEGLDWKSIAKILGKSIIATRVLHHRIIKKLRQEV
jgi:RNA polymerase sigma-70 factor (ECF subfamily)